MGSGNVSRGGIINGIRERGGNIIVTGKRVNKVVDRDLGVRYMLLAVNVEHSFFLLRFFSLSIANADLLANGAYRTAGNHDSHKTPMRASSDRTGASRKVAGKLADVTTLRAGLTSTALWTGILVWIACMMRWFYHRFSSGLCAMRCRMGVWVFVGRHQAISIVWVPLQRYSMRM